MLVTLLLAVAAPIQPAPLQVYADPAPASLHVRYGDLDLARAADRKTFDRRVTRAIARLCPTEQTGKSTASAAGLACRRTALKQVEPQRQRALARAGAPVLVSDAR